MLVAIARELGGEMNADARSNAATLGPALVDVITRMHARPCQIAEEVIVLSECGFANGAMARWRTMHEVFVVASFISKHGEKCAKAYCEHQAVESKKGSDEYALGFTNGLDTLLFLNVTSRKSNPPTTVPSKSMARRSKRHMGGQRPSSNRNGRLFLRLSRPPGQITIGAIIGWPAMGFMQTRRGSSRA
jgi:hypothetical protein